MPRRALTRAPAPEFLIVRMNSDYLYGRASSEVVAVAKAKQLINERSSDVRAAFGVYQLVSLVKPLEIPVKIEKVSCCQPAKKGK